MDGGAWPAAVHGVQGVKYHWAKSQTWLSDFTSLHSLYRFINFVVSSSCNALHFPSIYEGWNCSWNILVLMMSEKERILGSVWTICHIWRLCCVSLFLARSFLFNVLLVSRVISLLKKKSFKFECHSFVQSQLQQLLKFVLNHLGDQILIILQLSDFLFHPNLYLRFWRDTKILK